MTDTAPSLQDVVAFIRDRDPHTVFQALGIEVTTFGRDQTVVEVDVGERLFQHAGIVHGGVYVLLMESAASICAALTVDVTKNRVAGQEISASHLRPVTEGRLVARARPLHTGKTSIVYACDVECGGRLVSTGRCTMAIRPFA
ncbi:MAG: hotdog fold thioesterase [Deltaproteobacteria bacterium]|nr:hotdog fold thioesterase [Deltaproteobacteria bacterium]